MKIIIILTTLILISLNSYSQKNAKGKNINFHSFKVKNIEGKEFDLASLKGKKVLVVNTASKCGLTPQYRQLQEFYEMYGGSGFTIVAFPANNFLSQEPGSNEEIKTFCEKNYGVTFPIMEKISVKGNDIHQVFKWLTNKSENGKMDATVQWNFQKFLIDENGNLVDVLSPRESPDSEKIINWIKGN